MSKHGQDNKKIETVHKVFNENLGRAVVKNPKSAKIKKQNAFFF